MKTKFNNRELCHVWANQTQSAGQGSSMYFEGPLLYSYGPHFCIAKVVDDNTIFFTSRSYSTTTAKHKSFARQAIAAGIKIVYMALPEMNLYDSGNGNVNVKSFAFDLINQLSIIESKRVKEETRTNAIAQIAETLEGIKIYLAKTGQSLSKKQTNINDELARLDLVALINRASGQWSVEEFTKYQAKKQKRQKAIEKKEEERKAIENAEKIAKWKRGQNVYLPAMATIFLRVIAGSIETSLGATVDLSSAKVLFDMIREGKEIKGHLINGYEVKGINGVLTVGCHAIGRDEINRIAKKMKWGKI